MAVRELQAPATSRTRKPKYPFSEKEVEQAVKMLKDGKTPGVGPYEGEDAIRQARTAAQSLSRYVKNIEPDMVLGTKAWEDEDGKCFAVLRVKE